MAVNTPHFYPQSGKSKVSSTDTTADYLVAKILAGTNVTISRGGAGGDETLTISSAAGTATFSTEVPSPLIDGTTSSFSVSNIPKLLFLNGQYQTQTIDYSVSGTGPYTIAYTQTPAAGSQISLY